jgi:hypothetical protein
VLPAAWLLVVKGPMPVWTPTLASTRVKFSALAPVPARPGLLHGEDRVVAGHAGRLVDQDGAAIEVLHRHVVAVVGAGLRVDGDDGGDDLGLLDQEVVQHCKVSLERPFRRRSRWRWRRGPAGPPGG